MLELLNRVRRQLTELWERQDRKARRRFLVIVGICAAVLITSVVLLTRTEWEILRQGMDPADAGEILRTLQEQGVKVRPVGTTALEVPKGQADLLNMQLSSMGAVTTGFTYDIYALGRGFGATDADRRQYAIYQIQERIQATIMLSSLIKHASVTLTLPDDSRVLLQSDRQPATAAVVLTLNGDAVLSPEQVSSIKNYVATSVEGLIPDNVTVTDSLFNQLTGEVEPSQYDIMLNQQQLTERWNANVQQQLTVLMAAVFGFDNVRTTVFSELVFDDQEVESITFYPVVGDEGIAVAMENLNEKATAMSPPADVEGVDENGGAPEYPEYDSTTGSYSNVVSRVNYEVSQSHEMLTKAKGTLDRLTASIVINGDIFDEEDAQKVRNIASGALGLTAEQANAMIFVEFLPFYSVSQRDAMYSQAAAERQRQDLYALINMILPIVLIFVMLLIIIFQVFRLLTYKPEPVEVHDLLTPEQLDLLGLDIDGTPKPEEDLEAQALEEQAIKQKDIREKLEEIINNNPAAVAELLRNWLVGEDGW